MPSFLPNLNDLRGLAITFNPLNVFSSADDFPSPKSPPSATPGPGPSTLANASTPPTRPPLNTVFSSSPDSLEGTGLRKKSSGNVVIAHPEVDGNGEATMRPKGKRRERPLSMVSGVTEASSGETRRRKKVPWDTYIIVRPPPTNSKNPLNLQIQLIVKPNRRIRDRSGSAVSSTVGIESISGAIPVDSPSSEKLDPPSTALEPRTSVAGVPEEAVDVRTELPAAAATNLKRSSSVKSSDSRRSSSASTASNSGGGQKKRVEPMFNLTVHSVMQSTVVWDAATEAKVAKFLKRGIDIVGVGILEPSEVWHPAVKSASAANLFYFSSNSDDGLNSTSRQTRPRSVMSLTHPLSPTSTHFDVNGRSSFDKKRPSIDLRALNPAGLLNQEGEGGRTKQLLGKIFRKKGAQELEPTKTALSRMISPTPSYVSYNGAPPPNPGHSMPNPVVHVKAPSTTTTPTAAEAQGHAIGPPTFGTAPLVIHRRSSGTNITAEGAVTGLTGPVSLGICLSNSSALSADHCTALPMLPSTRPIGYTWTVRKWAKKNTDGWAAHLGAAAAAGLDMVNGALTGEADNEVVFEWVKMRGASNAAGSTVMRRYSHAGTIASSCRAYSRSRASGTVGPEGDAVSLTETTPTDGLAPLKRSASPLSTASPLPSPKLDARPEPVRRVSASTSPVSRNDSSSETELTLDEGEDSDPEDSETPWACSIWVKRTGQRQLLGTLTPAPHHPKVVGILKIPMVLDSIALTNVRGREGKHAEMASRVREGVALTEENLKDVVCVTAMWLVAREEFGGLGRKRKL